jgi:hypothetical protein
MDYINNILEEYQFMGEFPERRTGADVDTNIYASPGNPLQGRLP